MTEQVKLEAAFTAQRSGERLFTRISVHVEFEPVRSIDGRHEGWSCTGLRFFDRDTELGLERDGETLRDGANNVYRTHLQDPIGDAQQLAWIEEAKAHLSAQELAC